jgi:uncharacterized membrane protein
MKYEIDIKTATTFFPSQELFFYSILTFKIFLINFLALQSRIVVPLQMLLTQKIEKKWRRSTMRNNAVLKKALFSLSFILTLYLGTSFLSLGLAQEDKDADNRPERGISMAFEYPEVIINKGDDVTVDLLVKNKGKQDENVYFAITSSPPGWKTKIKSYSFSVMSVHVPEGEDKNVQFFTEPDEEIKPGLYTFKVDARTEDGKYKVSHNLQITLKRAKEREKGSIELTTSYPVLRGPSDGKFEFSLDVKNKTDKEDTFNLTSKGPKDWQINFKPPYEDKYISSLRLKDNESKSLNVEITPGPSCKAGEYVIPVAIFAGASKAEAELKVNITGTYRLEAGTATGLLSLEAEKGKPGNISIYVRNDGSATINNIEFLSVKPENWKVEFEPEKIDFLEPGSLKQVEVSVVPGQESLVGDYAVGLNIKGEKTSDDLEMRVTVKASAAWGWIGIGIILLVIIGLFGLFVSLGRR